MVDYEQYIKSPEWDAKRAQVLARAGGRCERCGERAMLQLHHLDYESLGNESLDDLEALCEDCHADADEERATETEERAEEQRQEWEDDRFEARFLGWARAVFGEGWETKYDEQELRERFISWLEENDDGL